MKKIIFLTVLLCLVLACNKQGDNPTPSTQSGTTQTTNQVPYDWDFYTDPSRLAVVKNEPNPEYKKLYYQVYGTPSGGWFDGLSPTPERNDGYLKAFIDGAERAQKTPIVVIYGIPNRDCGSFSKGGHPTADSYRSWIDRVSAIIGQRRAVVIVEPDAINYCGYKKGSAQYNQRAELLTYVGKTLQKNNPKVVTYLHAGNSLLVTQHPEAVAAAVTDGGLAYMRGFALNVSGLGGTAEEQEGAEKFVSFLATKGLDMHYVIDTGRSGINRPKHQNPNAPYNSCNNFNAALGIRSTTRTTAPHADAYLWINGGGGSDGECNMGAPAAGKPYPEYTRALINNAIRVKSIEMLEVPQNLMIRR